MIIGLSGYARSGKDEAAKGLEFFGFKRVSFADKMREFLYVLNPLVMGTNEMPVRLKYVVDRYGWDGYKETPWGQDMRELMQRLGTECGREMLYEDVWVDAALDDYRTGKIKSQVIPDVRFPNEAAAIKELGGFIVRIRRPGVHPANGHTSETALDDYDFDYTLNNDKDIAILHSRIANTALAFVL